MRARKTMIVAAAASVLVLLPATSAMAGSGPDPTPNNRSAAKSTAPSEAGNPFSAKAKAAGVCSDAYQIGATSYINRGGAHAASVKQFYSPKCDRNYGYLWVWQSFRDKVKDYDVGTGIYSYSRDEVVGDKWWNATNVQEFWSAPAATVDECTSAIGFLRAPGDPVPGQAASPKRC